MVLKVWNSIIYHISVPWTSEFFLVVKHHSKSLVVLNLQITLQCWIHFSHRPTCVHAESACSQHPGQWFTVIIMTCYQTQENYQLIGQKDYSYIYWTNHGWCKKNNLYVVHLYLSLIIIGLTNEHFMISTNQMAGNVQGVKVVSNMLHYGIVVS